MIMIRAWATRKCVHSTKGLPAPGTRHDRPSFIGLLLRPQIGGLRWQTYPKNHIVPGRQEPGVRQDEDYFSLHFALGPLPTAPTFSASAVRPKPSRRSARNRRNIRTAPRTATNVLNARISKSPTPARSSRATSTLTAGANFGPRRRKIVEPVRSPRMVQVDIEGDGPSYRLAASVATCRFRHRQRRQQELCGGARRRAMQSESRLPLERRWCRLRSQVRSMRAKTPAQHITKGPFARRTRPSAALGNQRRRSVSERASGAPQERQVARS